MNYKIVTLLILVSISFQWVIPIQSLAQENVKQNKVIQFDEKTAKDLAREVNLSKENKERVKLLLDEKKILQDTINKSNSIINETNLNAEAYKKQSEEYKKAFLDKQADLDKEIKRKPSKLTWFVIGAVVTIVAGSTVVILTK